MRFFDFPSSELAFFSAGKNLEGTTCSIDILKRSGVFIVRNLISAEQVKLYRDAYEFGLQQGYAEPRPNHLTEVSFELDSPLAGILFEPQIATLSEQLCSGKPGLHNIRIVRKDLRNTQAVFVHQDSPYCLGFFDRFSMFVALTSCSADNGGLFVYPGTHHFGYLGDAGSISDDLSNQLFRMTPDLEPGDCLVMHSAVWHGSTPNNGLTDRVMYDIQIQPVSDPSTLVSLCQEPLPSWRLRMDNKDIFSNSRVQRCAKLLK